jgi:threonine synthase
MTADTRSDNEQAGWSLRCIETGVRYPADVVRHRSETGGLVEVDLDLSGIDGAGFRAACDERRALRNTTLASGVWRYRELLFPVADGLIATRMEGNTPLYPSAALGAWCGVRSLSVKHEGHNPTGSFKDRGMTTGVTAARMLGQRCVACASTGNTSASMASYAAIAGMKAVVFVPAGGVAAGKLAQARLYGAHIVQIEGNFDDAMRLVEEVCAGFGVYLLNSINPFRIEGQKAIGIELVQDLGWSPPDWIALPGGNLGNTSAIFKGLSELRRIGVIDRLPRLAVIQASGAAPLYAGFLEQFRGGPRVVKNPETIASAIRIGAPASWGKCVAAIEATNGVVASVTDGEIIEAKRRVDASGIGAESASCASVAGCRRLVEAGVIAPDAEVVCVLTGNVLKDAEDSAERLAAHAGLREGPVCRPTLDAVRHRLERILESEPS